MMMMMMMNYVVEIYNFLQRFFACRRKESSYCNNTIRKKNERRGIKQQKLFKDSIIIIIIMVFCLCVCLCE